MVKILLISDDGSLGLDISQKLTDVQFHRDALENIPPEMRAEIIRLLAANRKAYRLKPSRRSIRDANER